MRSVRPFEEYCQEGVVRKGRPDPERAKSLVLESDRKLRSLQTNLDKVGITDDNANDFAEHCYDILLLLVRAKLYTVGYSAAGQGAHEAEVAYLRLLKCSEADVRFMDQLRYLRNGILYYGKQVDEEYAEKVIAFTKRLQPGLRGLASRAGSDDRPQRR